jgi:hypothetical protein
MAIWPIGKEGFHGMRMAMSMGEGRGTYRSADGLTREAAREETGGGHGEERWEGGGGGMQEG